jgi:cytochrome c
MARLAAARRSDNKHGLSTVRRRRIIRRLAQPEEWSGSQMKNKTGALALLALTALAASPAWAADSGDTLFRRYCFVCHSTEPGQNKVGPSLAGVFGRPSGDEAGFNYSDAMQAAHVTWDEPTLDKYLTEPKAVVPGTKMLFPGLKNADERHAVIDYLKSLKS